jgi:hypothetical protein
MPPAPRGSAKLSPANLKQLQAIASQSGKLVYWLPKGQPVPDTILGSVIASRGQLGAAIDKMVGVPGLSCRFEVFPLGIVNPEEFLVTFEQ